MLFYSEIENIQKQAHNCLKNPKNDIVLLMLNSALPPQQLLHPWETLSIDCSVRLAQIEHFTIKYSAPPAKYYPKVNKTTTIYRQLFPIFGSCFYVCSSAATVGKSLCASPHNLTCGLIKSNGLPSGPPFSCHFLFISSFFFSLLSHNLSLSRTCSVCL